MLIAMQEHYCVAIGINDATGAFSNFGITKQNTQNRMELNAD